MGKTADLYELDNRQPSFKNKLINGDFRINQRGDIDTAPVVANNDDYVIDRCVIKLTTVSTTVQRLSDQLVNGKTVNTLKLIATATGTATIAKSQRLEALCKGEELIFGAWVKSNNANARLLVRDSLNTYSSSPHTGDGTFQFLTVVVPSVEVTTTFLNVYVSIADANNGNASITTGDYIESTMWQLEEGSTATAFEQRPIGLELSLCQRYFEKMKVSTYLYNTTSSSCYLSHTFLVQKRVVPTLDTSLGTIYGGSTAVNIFDDSLTMFRIYTTIVGYFGFNGFLLINAEL